MSHTKRATRFVFTDRYAGRKRPNPATVCRGKCEGMGYYPDVGLIRAKGISAGDTPFVKCPDCGGTGKRK